MHIRQRLLAEVRAHDAPHGLGCRLSNPSIVGPLRRAEVGQHFLQTGSDCCADRSICVVYAAQRDPRGRDGPAAAVDHERGGGRTVPQKLAAFAQRWAVQRYEHVAVAPQVVIMKQGDDGFVDVVTWVLQALLIAEDMGITKENVDKFKASPTNPVVERLLGVTPGIGKRLGLDDSWGYATIKAMGNFGEIYERNLGKDSPYKLDRGMNALWQNGGVFVPMLLD